MNNKKQAEPSTSVQLTKRENQLLQGGLLAQIGSLRRGMLSVDKEGQATIDEIIFEMKTLLSKLKSAEPESKFIEKSNPFK